ncbi:MAG: metallopeptidase family protein [Patescibacteria group bacterium]
MPVRMNLRNVAFVVEDDARSARVSEQGVRFRGELLGLYQGVPLPARSAYYSGVLPDKITIFRKPIERLAGSDDQAVASLVAEVVHHEIGHYLGMDERTVRQWENHRREKKR